jgi:molecular chaperone GrpE
MKTKQQEKNKEENLSEEHIQEDELLGQLQRLQAEFINFRTRVEKEKAELSQRARETILLKFLDVKDNFDRAPKLDDGMTLIYKQFLAIFQEEHIHSIETKEFNPTLHEAVATDPNTKKDHIVDVIQPGYLHKERVIRPAKVVVGVKEDNTKQGEKQNE